MTKKYDCGQNAADKCRDGAQTVYEEELPSIREVLQHTDNEINEGIDQTFKNKRLRNFLKNRIAKTAISGAMGGVGYAVYGFGMAIGGEPGSVPAFAGLVTMGVATMGVVHNVSDMKMTKALYHGVKNGVKTTVAELAPEARKIKNKVEQFFKALTQKDIPMTVRHFDQATGKMVEYKMPEKTVGKRIRDAFRAARRSR